MLSAGESCGWGRALVPRHWEEGECQGEDRFWEAASCLCHSPHGRKNKARLNCFMNPCRRFKERNRKISYYPVSLAQAIREDIVH